MGLQGAVLEHFYLRDDNPSTYNHGRGPKITAFTQESADVVRFAINRRSGFTTNLPNVASLVKPADVIPYRFGICPNADLTQESVRIIGHEWIAGTDDLRLFLADRVPDPLPVYPYGTMNLAPISDSALIKVWDRVLGQYTYLQTLAHSHNETTGRWAPDFTT
jgi:hypothetical protein